MTKRKSAVGSDAQAAMDDLRERRRRRRMTEEQKKDAERVRAYYDLPQAVKDGISKAADDEGLTASAVASVLLVDGLRRYREGELSLAALKEASISPRWDYRVADHEIVKVLRGSELEGSD